jgi:carbon-monoxide dehydrogenase medium subunit
MYAFTYERPALRPTPPSWPPAGGKVLAGGQTLLASMKLRLASPPSAGRSGRHRRARRHLP